MRKGIILFLLFLFIFLTALSVKDVYCADAITGPSVKAKRPAEKEKTDLYLWDFGQVKEGAVLKHEFILKNETSDILEINNIHTSCGCAVSESSKKSLLPQGSTVITVSFNSKGYSGPVTQFVYVHTDNADIQIVKFTIKADVVKGD